MKIFFYALREYDEKGFLEECAQKYGFEYGYTSQYPNMDNLDLAKGFDGVSIITNPIGPEMLDKMKANGNRNILLFLPREPSQQATARRPRAASSWFAAPNRAQILE